LGFWPARAVLIAGAFVVVRVWHMLQGAGDDASEARAWTSLRWQLDAHRLQRPKE
jgi:hypothetical protein